MIRRVAASLALLASLAAARPAAADQSMLGCIPSDCQVAVLVDFEQVNADPALAGTVGIYWSELVVQGGPPLESLTSLGLGVQLPKVAGAEPELQAALKGNAPLKGIEAFAESEKATLQTVEGRPMYVGPEAAILPSNDRTMVLVARTPELIARMIDSTTGNITTLPGFSLQPTAPVQPFLYLFGGGFDEATRKTMHDALDSIAREGTRDLSQQGWPPQLVTAASSILRNLPLLSRAEAMEVALLMDATNMTFVFRVTTANPDHAAKLRPVFDGLAEFLKTVMAETINAAPPPVVSGSGATLEMTLALPKHMGLAQLNMALASGRHNVMAGRQRRAAAGGQNTP